MAAVSDTSKESEMASVADTQNEEKSQESTSDEITTVPVTEADIKNNQENQAGENQNESGAQEAPRGSSRSSQPSPGTERPASGSQRASSGTQRPSSGAQQPSPRPSSGTQRPSSGAQQPSPRPPSGTQRPSSGTQRPSSGTQQPSSATQKPSRPSSGTQRPSSGTQRPSSGTQRPSSGTERPLSATKRPSSATKESVPNGEEAQNGMEEPDLEAKNDHEDTKSEKEKETDDKLVQKSSQEQTQSTLANINEEITEEKESESKVTEGPTDNHILTSNTNEPEEEQASSSRTDRSDATSSGAMVKDAISSIVSQTADTEEGEASLGRMAQGHDASSPSLATNNEETASTGTATAEGTEAPVKKIKKPVKLTVAEAQQVTRNLMVELNSFESYDNAETVKALKALGRLYFDQKSKRKAICEVLIETDYPALVMKLLVMFNKIGIFKSDDVWFPAYYTLNSAWNYTDASKELSKSLAEKGIIQLMLANITHKPYLENIGSKLSPTKNPLVSTGTAMKPKRKFGPRPAKSLNNVNYVVKSSLSILQNVSKVPENKPIYVDNKALEAIKPFTTSDNDFFKATAMMIITTITSEADNAVLEDTGAIPFMVRGIRQALKTKNHRYRGFSPTELAECLTRMAVNDSNKKKITAEGALPLLTEMLSSKDSEEQAAAAQCLWQLSFDKEVRDKIIEEPGCLDQLIVLTSSDEKAVAQSANGAMWKLHGEEQHQKTSTTEVKEGGRKNHVMISYNWDHQDLILKIAERLKSDGYTVWIDVEQMGGSTLGAMAEAVEKAAVVVICMSEKYKNSPNCRTEGEYTFQLHKPIVPILVQRKYRADGWLGMLIGAKLYTDFSKHAFEKAYSMLIKELKGRGHAATQAPEVIQREDTSIMLQPPPTASGTRPPPSTDKIVAWSASQVSQWLTDHDLQSCKEAFAEVDGKLLAALLTLRFEAPEYFYQTLEKKFSLDLINMLRLINAMSALP